MAGEIAIQIDDKQFLRMVKAGDREYRRAAADALTKAAMQSRTRAVSGLRHQVNLPARALRKRFKVKRATPYWLTSELRASARGVNVRTLRGHRPPPTRGGALGDADIGVMAHGRHWPKAFAADAVPAVYLERQGQRRYPLTSVKIQIYDEAKEVIEKVVRRSHRELLEKLLPRQLEFRLKQAAGAA